MRVTGTVDGEGSIAVSGTGEVTDASGSLRIGIEAAANGLRQRLSQAIHFRARALR
jgi:hypothetical protein